MDFDIFLFYGADVALILAIGTLLGKIVCTKSSAGKIVYKEHLLACQQDQASFN